MSFAEEDLTRNRFLGGRLEILQPAQGYRAGVDPVLLAASVPARPGQTVLELGVGAGVASLCLASRVSGVVLTGVELQHDYAALARRNAAQNGIDMAVHVADLRDLPAEVRGQSFDHVMANPPYYDRNHGTASSDAGRDLALAGSAPLESWISVAARRLRPRGMLSIIQDMRRLPELLVAADGLLGSLEVLPIAPRHARAPRLMLFRARKGGRAAFRLHPSLVMHDGDRHEADAESYRDDVRAVLRDGDCIDFG